MTLYVKPKRTGRNFARLLEQHPHRPLSVSLHPTLLTYVRRTNLARLNEDRAALMDAEVAFEAALATSGKSTLKFDASYQSPRA